VLFLSTWFLPIPVRVAWSRSGLSSSGRRNPSVRSIFPCPKVTGCDCFGLLFFSYGFCGNFADAELWLSQLSRACQLFFPHLLLCHNAVILNIVTTYLSISRGLCPKAVFIGWWHWRPVISRPLCFVVAGGSFFLPEPPAAEHVLPFSAWSSGDVDMYTSAKEPFPVLGARMAFFVLEVPPSYDDPGDGLYLIFPSTI